LAAVGKAGFPAMRLLPDADDAERPWRPELAVCQLLLRRTH
jgi:hypothetical protein